MLLAAPTLVVGQAEPSTHSANPDQVCLIIRSDDAGMSHSVNMGLERLIATGFPVSVSVMFPTPWYQETVEILDALTSSRFTAAPAARNVRLLTYRQLIAIQGLQSTRKPEG